MKTQRVAAEPVVNAFGGNLAVPELPFAETNIVFPCWF